MAKKDKKKSKKKDTPGADAVGAVRTAVERTFQATADSAQSTRTRAQDLVDEVTHAAARVREMIEQVGVLEDLKGLRGDVENLARRVAALETGGRGAKRGATATRSTATRAKPTGGSTRAKSGTAKSSGGARKPAAKRSGSGSSRSSSRSTASKASRASKASGSSRSSGTRKTTKRSSSAKKSS